MYLDAAMLLKIYCGKVGLVVGGEIEREVGKGGGEGGIVLLV